MHQSRADSLIEALVNTMIGFCVTMVANLIIYPSHHVTLTFSQQLSITFWFTIVSVVRGYTLRRIFKNKPIWLTIKAYWINHASGNKNSRSN